MTFGPYTVRIIGDMAHIDGRTGPRMIVGANTLRNMLTAAAMGDHMRAAMTAALEKLEGAE